MSDSRPVLLVTGGSRGIGAALVRGAAERGFLVGFSYRQDRNAAERLVSALGEQGYITHAVCRDSGSAAEIVALFDEVEQVLGPVTSLVNNAGITGPIGPFHDVEETTLRRILDVNVLGTMLAAREAIRRWTARGTAGQIVNLSSTAATLGAPAEFVHYAASKAAVEAFTVGLAREVASSGTRVNAVAPGTVHTDIHAAAGEPDRPARVVSRVPMGRIGEPDEIARAVLWLLSDEASYVTGAILRVSGGL